MNKYFMLGLAGLAFAACSNEEDATNNLQGNGAVTIRVVSPMTKTLGDATTETDGTDVIPVVPQDGLIHVKLNAGSGEQTATIDADATSTVTFYGVTNPTSVEAWVNNGDVEARGTTMITDLKAYEPEEIPAYGSTSQIDPAGRVEMNSGVTYEMYEATVELEIPVARLEVSGIKHVNHTTASTTCEYTTLTIDGIYLDKVASTDGGEIVDYHMPEVGTEGEDGYIPAPILADVIPSASFLDPNSVWPAARPGEGEGDPAVAQSYNYYFYPAASQMPILKIYFASAEGVNNPSEPRYAVIKSYNGNANFQFEKGTIYRITDVTLKDENIIGDEEGNPTYGVDVTVVEAQWDVETISGEWVEQQ